MHSGGSSERVPRVLGRYRLLNHKLGSGNYATVVEGVQTDLEVHVAVKIIDTNKIADSYVLQHLSREASLLRRLAHPNVIAAFETLRAGPLYCLVTELVTGGELSSYVSRQPRGHLDEKPTLLYAGQLLSALAHMHDRGVVHRDLKMKNILLDHNREFVKIVDFGLSNVWTKEAPLRTHCGSPGYAAPEIYILGKPYGPEVDMWSFGVVLYGMAVGRLPFHNGRDKNLSAQDRRKRLIAQINKGATELHVRAMSHFTPHFSNMVVRLLTPAPSQRLTLDEALAHPWLADTPLRIRGYHLNARDDEFILSQLAFMLEMPESTVDERRRADSLGEVAALYNILAHKHLNTYHALWSHKDRDTNREAYLQQLKDKQEEKEQEKERDESGTGTQDNRSDPSQTTDSLQPFLTADPVYNVERGTSPVEMDNSSRTLRTPISRLTLQPVAITVVPPALDSMFASRDSLVDSFTKRPAPRSPRIRSSQLLTQKHSTGTSAEDDFMTAATVLQHRSSTLVTRPPKSVSFSAIKERVDADAAVANRKNLPTNENVQLASVAVSTTSMVDREIQTTSRCLCELNQRQSSASKVSFRLPTPKKRVGVIVCQCEGTNTTERMEKMTEPDAELSQDESQRKVNNARSAPLLMRKYLSKTKSLMFAKMGSGNNSADSKFKDRAAPTSSQSTSRQIHAIASGCQRDSLKVMGKDDDDDIFKAVRSRSKNCLRPSHPSRRPSTCSTMYADSSTFVGHSQTDHKCKFKKWQKNNPSLHTVYINRYKVELALARTQEKMRQIPTMGFNSWSRYRKTKIRRPYAHASALQRLPRDVLKISNDLANGLLKDGLKTHQSTDTSVSFDPPHARN